MKRSRIAFAAAPLALAFVLYSCTNPAGGASAGGVSDTTAPGEVTGLQALADYESVHLSWTDPTDQDFVAVSIIYTPDGESETMAWAGFQSASFMGLSNGTPYTFIVRTVDSEGNYSAGTSVTCMPYDTINGDSDLEGIESASSIGLDTWIQGSLSSNGTYAWYSFDAEAEQSYLIQWQDYNERELGSTYSAGTEVSAYGDDQMTPYYCNGDQWNYELFKGLVGGYSTTRKLAVEEDGKVYLRVYGSQGSFAVKVSLIEPSEVGISEDGALVSLQQNRVQWYTFQGTPGTVYRVYWTTTTPNSGVLFVYDITAYSPDKSTVYFGPTNDDSTPPTLTYPTSGQALFRFTQRYSGQYGRLRLYIEAQ